MTSGPSTPSAASRGFPRAYPPMAVAYGDGVECGAGADAVREAATAEGFDGPKVTIVDAARSLPLARYPFLTVVAPSIDAPGGDRVGLLQPVRTLVGGYRSRHPEGLAQWRAGLVKPYDVGILQVVAREDLLTDRTLAPTFAKTCARHTLEHLLDDPTVIFRIFEDGFPGAAPATLVPLDEDYITALWDGLREWGLRHVDDVDPLDDRVTGMREHFHNNVRYQLRLPFGDDDPRSRLDFILDEPDMPHPFRDQEAWTRDGAEAMRIVLAALTEIVPGLENPARTRGRVKRFSRFCGDLKTMRYYLKTVPEAQRPPFSYE